MWLKPHPAYQLAKMNIGVGTDYGVVKILDGINSCVYIQVEYSLNIQLFHIILDQTISQIDVAHVKDMVNQYRRVSEVSYYNLCECDLCIGAILIL